MKKALTFLLTTILLVCLVGCGGGGDNTETKTNTATSKTNTSQTSTKTSDNTKTTSKTSTKSGANEAEAEYNLNLPKNLKMKTTSGTLYKIGDDFMFDYGSEYDYFKYNGQGEYYYYFWNDGSFLYGEGTVVLPVFFEYAFGLYAPACEKVIGDTKTICGKQCQAYKEAYVNIKYYVNEETGVFFEMWMSGASVPGMVISEWDTSITEFPVAPPAK